MAQQATSQWLSSFVHQSYKATSNNDSQLESLHERLAKLEQTLEKALLQNAKQDAPQELAPASQQVQSSHHVPPTNRTIPFEGESSFGRQAYLASQISELTSPEAASSPTIMDELKALRSVIQEQRPVERQGRDAQNPSQLNMQLVPSEFVLRLFRVLRESQSLLFLFHPVHDLAQLEILCQRIYFPVNPLSTGELTVFHGMLYFSMWELQCTPSSGLSADEVQRYRDICWTNFQAGLDTHELAAIPTYENALALTMAALDSQLRGKKMLQWNLISAAAKHCLALGYHRRDTFVNLAFSESESMLRLFWHVFMSDASLSLTLGRAPIIQEYDVDAPALTVSKDPKRAAWDEAFVSFVRFSSIQASIYRQLYSPMSRGIDTVERQQVVMNLAEKLRQWYTDWHKIDFSNAYHSHIFETTFSGVDVTYYSVLTLLHRGVTTSNAIVDISPECFKAAKQGLESHLVFYPRAVSMGPNAVSMYADWILLFTSFTPYIVTFLHCIGTSDPADLVLLRRVLESIEQIASTAKTCKPQYELCHSLLRIAEAFIDSRSMDMSRAVPQLDTALNLSLQNPLLDDCSWSYFQTTLDEWSGQALGTGSFTLGSRIDSHAS
ncbi:retrovirus polyprotein [Purpureocillium lavendulum]|uniref:Retrovirus polyprotein n=1 Tax=Purpureocillium lavendulum TaxID=1247861 RepID=A0AB34FGV5_9HYPO|nr:retrovirus polyprotein [Purpureocillium lavendulum]